MKREKYFSILSLIEGQKVWDFDECLSSLIREFSDEKRDTLSSILSQQYQKRVKNTYHRKFGDQRRRAEVYRTYQSRKALGEKNVIFQLARSTNFSPWHLSRLIAEECLKPVSKPELNYLVRNPDLIEDGELAVEVFSAGVNDGVYGYQTDAIKHSIGLEHEQKLKRELDRAGIFYKDEAELRKAGHDKTPDVLLEVPFCVGRRVVNWIESKALFGDEELHARYLVEQLHPYWNRYGPGMVIYWHGFVEEIAEKKRFGGVLVREAFPNKEEIILFEPNDYEAEDRKTEALIKELRLEHHFT